MRWRVDSRLLGPALIAVVAVVGVITRSGLFADGAWFALNIQMSDLGMWVGNPERWIATVVTQAPYAAVASVLHLSVPAQSALYSSALVVVPALIWIAALVVAWKSHLYWWLVLAWAVSAGLSTFFFVGEYNVAYALVGLAGSIVITRALTWKTVAALMVIGLVLTRAYESMVFLGPLLAVMTVVALRAQAPRHRGLTAGSVVVAGVFVMTAIVALVGINSPNNPGELQFEYQWALLDFWPAVVSVFVVLFWLVAATVPGLARLVSFAAVALSALVMVLGLGSFVLTNLSVNPWQYYNARVLAGGLLFVALSIASWLRWSRRAPAAVGNFRVGIAHGLLAGGLTMTLLSTMVGFSQWLNKVEQTVRSGSGLILFEDTDLDSLYKWDWALPSLSLVLQESADQGVVLPPESFWNQQPFDPFTDLPRIQD